jgi:PAS domain S-box-containing protein
MTRAAICLLPALFFLTSSTFSGEVPTSPENTVLSGCELDYPPFCVVTPEGAADGFSVELLRAALKIMGREATFRTGNWNEIKTALEKGELQALPLVGRTPEREAVYDFTFPYLTLHGAIVVRNDTRGINLLKDLRGKTVAVMKGDNAEEFINRIDLDARLISTPTFSDALKLLSDGKCDAVIMQRLLAFRLIQEAKLKNLTVVGKPLEQFRQDFCFAVREGDSKLLALLNEGLSLVIADGTFRHLQAKWFSFMQSMDKRRIVVGGDHDFPPYEFLDERGQPVGYNVDLTRAIAEELGLDVEIRLGPWGEIRAQLEAGEIDLVQGMFYSSERDKIVDFTQPHTVINYVAIGRKGLGAPPSGLAGLKGKSIVVMKGDIMHDYARENALTERLATVETQEEALVQLSRGKHDFALVARIPALYWIKTHGLDNLVPADSALLSPEYCYAGMKNEHELVIRFCEGLLSLHEEGKKRKIHDRWLKIYEPNKLSFRDAVLYIALAVAPLALLLLGSIIWSRTLQARINQKTKDLQLEIIEREKIQKALMLEQAFSEKLFDAPQDTVFLFDPESGQPLKWNSKFTIVSGYSDEEISRMKAPDDFYTEEDLAKTRAATSQVMAGHLGNVELSLITKSKTLIPFDYSGAAIKTADGKTLLLSIGRDVTERRKAEEEISNKKEFLNRIIDQSPFAIWIADTNGILQRANRALCKMLNVREDQLVGVYNVLEDPLVERQGVMPLVRSVFTEGKTVNFSCRWSGAEIEKWNFKTTNPVDIDATMFPIYDRLGRMTNVALFWTDVTDRRKAELALRTSEQKYRMLFETMLDGFALHEMIFDEDGKPVDYRFLEVNPAFEQMTGLSADKVLGKTVTEALPNIEKHWIDAYSEVVRTGKAKRFEEFSQDLGRYFEVLAFPTEPGKFANVFVDITERKQLEEQLRQSEKMQAVGQLAGGIAHDFNNQLSGILGYADLLASKLEDETLVRYANGIRSATERAATLTGQLLAFSRKGKYLSIAVKIDKVIADVISILEHSIDKRIKIQQDLKAWPTTTIGDPNQLQNALLNLALNARDAMPQGGEIIFRTDIATLDNEFCRNHPYELEPGQYLKVSVTDNGCGMDKTVQKHIFEPFFTTKELGKGTGMGLASVYGTVRSHHGAITVYSEIGHGSTFRLYLPLADEDAEETALPRDIPVTGNARILIVDDEEVVREVGAEMLRELGYRVTTCKDGQEAVEYYKKTWSYIDLVVLDMVMPELGGKDAFIAMREINPHVRAILSSGYSINGEAQSILDEGVISFIGKPFRQAAFAQVVAHALGVNR